MREPRTVSGIVLKPGCRVEPFRVTANFREVQTLVGGHFQIVPWPTIEPLGRIGAVACVNEDGRPDFGRPGLPPCVRADDSQVLYGPIVFLGSNGEDEEDLSPDQELEIRCWIAERAEAGHTFPAPEQEVTS